MTGDRMVWTVVLEAHRTHVYHRWCDAGSHVEVTLLLCLPGGTEAMSEMEEV